MVDVADVNEVVDADAVNANEMNVMELVVDV